MNILNLLKQLSVGRASSRAVAPPTQSQNRLSPRAEPANLSAGVTISLIQSAIRQSERGETTQLFQLYRDSLLGDDHIQGELSKRKLAVLGQPLAILPANKENPDDVLAAAVCLRAVEDCENWSDGIGALMDSAAIWPVTLCENIFRVADPMPVTAIMPRSDGAASSAYPAQLTARLQYTFKRLEPINPMLFCFQHNFRSTSPTPLDEWEPNLRLWPTDPVSGRITRDSTRATPLDPTRHILHRGHLLTQIGDHWGGPGRCLLAWWVLRILGRDWFGRFMERYGSPFPVGKTNTQDAAAVSFLETAFSTATKIGGLVIGQDDSVELKEAVVAGGAQGHETWHRVCNDAISNAITGFKSSAAPAGLNAGEDNRTENIRDDIRIFDQKRLGDTLRLQPFARLLRFNGLSGNIRVAWGGLSGAEAKTFADLLVSLNQAGLEPTDAAIPQMQERVGIELQRKAAAPSPFGILGGGSSVPPDPPTAQDAKPASLASHHCPPGTHLRWLAVPSSSHPMNDLAQRRVAALAAAYRGSMAPFRQAILDSTSQEDCLARLQKLYADWSPDRLQSEMESALQLCAAAGAATAKPG